MELQQILREVKAGVKFYEQRFPRSGGTPPVTYDLSQALMKIAHVLEAEHQIQRYEAMQADNPIEQYRHNALIKGSRAAQATEILAVMGLLARLLLRMDFTPDVLFFSIRGDDDDKE